MSVALVTGAASAIGAAVAARLERDGWDVARNELPGVAADGYCASADVADPAQVKAMVDRVQADLGPIGVLVNNAAAVTLGAIEELSEDEFWRIVDVNLSGAFYCAQACAPSMVALGFGRIISLSSEWGQIGWPNATAYSASKAGLISLTKGLARALGPAGITANAIAPSVVDTPGLRIDAEHNGVSLAEMRRRYAAQIPLRRLGDPAEIAALVAFLASDAAGTLTGQILCPNGGTTPT